MVNYISGKVSELTPTYVVIDNNGIGYLMEISLQTYGSLEGRTEAKIFVQSQANPRDGTTVEYGFFSEDERTLFRHITSVSGMGSSSARMVLSSLTADELRSAILSEDVARLKSIKGIGLKTAQRMVLELKDKIVKGEEVNADALFRADTNAAAEEASSALQQLGFNKANISKAIQAILKKNPSASVEQIIKAALQML